MSAVVRARYRTRCALCPDMIEANDNIVFINDRPVHEDCERSEGWEDHVAPATVTLKQVLDGRGELMHLLLETGFDPGKLPERIEMAMFEMVAAESTLRSLLDDVVGEHLPVQGGGIPLD